MVAAAQVLSNSTGKSKADLKDRSAHLIGSKTNSKVDRPKARDTGQRIEDRMKTKDKSRKWMWWFLGVIGAMQLYFVRELLAAFALFVLGFGAIALVIGALYMIHTGWAVAVERLAESKHPVVAYTKRRVSSVEDFARRGAVAAVASTEELAKRALGRSAAAR
jgi:hypothetical protein